MSKRDLDFKVSHVFPELVLKSLTESANKPFVISDIDKNNLQKGEYVVKINSSERMSVNAALREFLASLIAIELEIPTPFPAIIEITKEFVQTRLGFDDYARFEKSIGLNYGNKFLGENVVQFMPRDPGSYEGFRKNLQEIFIFDIFIENSDRSYLKPNLLVKEKDIFVIDHEIAFGFSMVLDIFKKSSSSKPWQIIDLMSIIEQHCLYANLKGRHFLAHDIFERFNKLNSKFWGTAQNLLPAAWKINDFFKIRDYLLLKVEHIDEFKEEIMEVLK